MLHQVSEVNWQEGWSLGTVCGFSSVESDFLKMGAQSLASRLLGFIHIVISRAEVNRQFLLRSRFRTNIPLTSVQLLLLLFLLIAGPQVLYSVSGEI